MQSTKLRLLVLEDEPNDAELEIAELEQAGFDCDWKRVDTREHFLAALESPDFDLILSDFALPSFDGLTALSLVLESNVNIPFILVSGTLGEEAAIGSLRAGATDYVLKTRLSRLGPVVQRALQEQAEHRERKRAEEALQANEKKLRLIINTSPIGICTVDPQGNFVTTNLAYEQMLGYSKEELRGLSFFEVTHPEDRPENKERFQNMFALKTTEFSLEKRYIRKDGKTVDVAACASVIVDAAGRAIFGTAFVSDITERKQQARALEESEEKMRTTLKSIGDAVIATDAAGRIELMNPIAENLTGWTLADAAGKSLKEVFPIFNEQTKEPVQNPVDLVLKTGKTVELANHTVLISKEGREIPIADSGAPIVDSDGTISGVVLAFRDQTNERATQNALAASAARLRRAQQVALLGDWQIDLATQTVTASKIALQIYGIDEKEWTIPDIQNISIVEHRERLGEAMTALVEHGVPYDIEFTIQRPNDGGRVEIHSVAEYDPESRQIFGVIQDITSRKASEKALAESEKRFRGMLEELSHLSVMGYGRDGTIRFWNKGAENLYGYTSEEAVGEKLTDLTIPVALCSFIEEAILMTEEKGVTPPASEFELRHKNGSAVHVLTSHANNLKKGEEFEMFCLDVDISERKRMEEAIERRIIALTRPMEEVGSVEFEELFDIKEIQRLQDEFSNATGTAAVIIRPDGNPITEPSNLTDHCQLIQATNKGCANCKKSGQTIGAYHPDGPNVQLCLSGKLLATAANITVGGIHIASWLIGQVRDEAQTEEQIRAYAQEIGMNEADLIEAYANVPAMPRKQFEHVAQALFTLANQLSTSAHQNIQQARFIAAQERADRMLQNFFEQPMNLNMIASFEGIIIQTNPGWEVHLGYSPSELTGRSHFDFLHPDDIASTNDQMAGLKQGKVVSRFKNRYRHKDGTFRHLEWSAVPSSKEKQIYAVGIDMTERAAAEAELRRLSTAIEQSKETVMITDTSGTIQYANPAFETTTGYRVDEAIGKNPRMLKSEIQNEAFYSNLWETISSGATWEGRIINKRKNGSLYTEEASISPIKDASEHIVNYVAVHRDISEELIKENELRQAQKMEAIGQLASGVAHDFNNILQGIQGFSELLQMTLASGSQEYDNATEIHKAALRATTLTRQLLTFSRKQTFHPEEIELNHTVHEASAFLNILLGETFELVLDLCEVPEPIFADQGQLSQVIMNLAVNARDAMPEGGRLTVSTRMVVFEQQDVTSIPNARTGSFACLAVTDSGCGMDAETAARIFDPFFTTKDVGSGTGLGLSVVYGIMKQCDGWINVYSEIDLGTTFRLYFPLVSPLKQNSGNRPHTSVYPADKRILLVEDDPDVCGMVIKMLSAAGYRVMATTNAEDGLALFKKEQGRFELLMSDMVLPGMNGSQLADAIRKINPTLPVMLFSGYTDHKERWKHLAKTDYLFECKPFTAQKLTDSIATIFKR